MNKFNNLRSTCPGLPSTLENNFPVGVTTLSISMVSRSFYNCRMQISIFTSFPRTTYTRLEPRDSIIGWYLSIGRYSSSIDLAAPTIKSCTRFGKKLHSAFHFRIHFIHESTSYARFKVKWHYSGFIPCRLQNLNNDSRWSRIIKRISKVSNA